MSVTKLRFTHIDRLLDEVEREKFDEIVLVGFKDGNYEMFSSGGDSKSKVVGALEVIKYELLLNK